MSRTRPTEDQRDALLITCGRCGAGRNEWCHTVAGKHLGAWSTYLHTARQRPLWRAWSRGYESGREAGANVARHRLGSKIEHMTGVLRKSGTHTTTFDLFADWLEGQLRAFTSET